MIRCCLIFLIYCTSDVILGHFSLSVEIYRFSWIRMITRLWGTYRVDDLSLFYHDFLAEPFLHHSIRLILSDIVVILRWSYFRHIVFHVIISVEHMSDFLDILIRVSLSWWQTSHSFPNWSFFSHWQTRLLTSSLVEHLGRWQTLSRLVTLVNHCWVTRANWHAYIFWVMDNLTFRYKGDRLEPFGYLHAKMHQLLYWGIFFIFFFLFSRWLISHLAFITFFAGHSFDDFVETNL